MDSGGLKKLPFEGEYYLSKSPKSSLWVVLTHNYGGNKSSVLRHAHLVNSLGYNAVGFNYSENRIVGKGWRFLRHAKWGLRFRWAQELHQILDELSGPKVMFTLSFPSVTTGMILPRRNDICGWVCDGGPFMDLFKCSWNFLIYAVPIKNKIQRATMTLVSYLSLSSGAYDHDLRKALRQLPSNFPILSFRAEKDLLVPPAAIQKVFSDLNFSNLEVVEIPDGNHLLGLRDRPDLYRPAVERLLKRAEEFHVSK